jgi:hypothetical protein
VGFSPAANLRQQPAARVSGNETNPVEVYAHLFQAPPRFLLAGPFVHFRRHKFRPLFGRKNHFIVSVVHKIVQSCAGGWMPKMIFFVQKMDEIYADENGQMGRPKRNLGGA